ncbi:MAG: DUF4143 domain-containing protein [Bifidobacteriaceae bacterium]|nr:DUF4143 domain-containing protein [Bifidobacteriaceae bacterium]
MIETFHVDRAGANHSTRRWQRASQSAVGGLPAWFAGEARHWASWTSGVNPAGCWRAREGAKVDLISEDDDGRGVGLEIKSLAVTRPKDLAGLRALRDAFGSRFAGGVLLSTGRLAYQAGRSIAVLPIRSLWSRS